MHTHTHTHTHTHARTHARTHTHTQTHTHTHTHTAAARADYAEAEKLLADQLSGLQRDAAWTKSYVVSSLMLTMEAMQVCVCVCARVVCGHDGAAMARHAVVRVRAQQPVQLCVRDLTDSALRSLALHHASPPPTHTHTADGRGVPGQHQAAPAWLHRALLAAARAPRPAVRQHQPGGWHAAGACVRLRVDVSLCDRVWACACV
jgi:hypothetical protein